MTPKERASMQQALDALEELFHSNSTKIAVEKYNTAHNALRESLSVQAEQEPVGWNDLDDHELAEKLGWRIGDPLYMTAVGLGQEAIHHFKAKNTALARTKDLTGDELSDLVFEYEPCENPFEFARAVIAADREKNK